MSDQLSPESVINLARIRNRQWSGPISTWMVPTASYSVKICLIWMR